MLKTSVMAPDKCRVASMTKSILKCDSFMLSFFATSLISVRSSFCLSVIMISWFRRSSSYLATFVYSVL